MSYQPACSDSFFVFCVILETENNVSLGIQRWCCMHAQTALAFNSVKLASDCSCTFFSFGSTAVAPERVTEERRARDAYRHVRSPPQRFCSGAHAARVFSSRGPRGKEKGSHTHLAPATHASHRLPCGAPPLVKGSVATEVQSLASSLVQVLAEVA